MAQFSEQKVQTRERILSEAASLLREVGPDAMRIGDVMARAGLTHGGFYAHFSSKDDLIGETISDMFARTHAIFMASLGHPDAAATLRGFVASYLSMAHRDASGRVCPLPPFAGYVTWLHENTRQRFETGLQSLVIGLSSILQRLGRPDPDIEARSILSEMVGALALSRTMTDPRAAEAHLAASRASIVARTGIAVG
jgi:TetR/AcrR family transcriptional repressor of nem operon